MEYLECNGDFSLGAWYVTNMGLTKRFGDVDPGHRGGAFEQDISALTLLPGIYKYCNPWSVSPIAANEK